MDGLIAGIGLLAVVVGLAWAVMSPGSFLFLPIGLLGLLLIAGGALFLVAGLLGNIGRKKVLGALLTVLVIVSALVAVIVVLALEVF